MRRMVLPLFIPAAFMVLPFVSGCVKRVWDAPGLSPGSAMAVSGDMRGETFTVDDLEVRSFMIELSTTNNRRFQFVILRSGVHQYDYFLDRLADGTFDLVEKRADGISLTRKSYPSEPAYSTVRTDIVDLLKGDR